MIRIRLFESEKRALLDTVVTAFNEGATAEEIVFQYPVLNLADVYEVISYYLHHRSEIDEYTRQQEEKRTSTRTQNEARFDSSGIRERLETRQRSTREVS